MKNVKCVTVIRALHMQQHSDLVEDKGYCTPARDCLIYLCILFSSSDRKSGTKWIYHVCWFPVSGTQIHLPAVVGPCGVYCLFNGVEQTGFPRGFLMKLDCFLDQFNKGRGCSRHACLSLDSSCGLWPVKMLWKRKKGRRRECLSFNLKVWKEWRIPDWNIFLSTFSVFHRLYKHKKKRRKENGAPGSYESLNGFNGAKVQYSPPQVHSASYSST